MIVPILLGFTVLISPPAQTAKRQPIRVLVVNEKHTDDWIAPGANRRVESARDLASALSGRVFKLVMKTEDAQMTIRITERIEGERETSVGFAGATPIFVTKHRGRSLVAVVRVGEREFTFIGTTDRDWHRAAGDLAKDIESWTKDNYERIAAEAK